MLTHQERQALPAHSIVLEPHSSKFDSAGRHVARQAIEAGLGTKVQCTACRLFFIQGDLPPERLAELTDLLLDPVVERVADTKDFDHFVDVALLPGVTDTEGESLLRAAHQMGFTEVTKASRAFRYCFRFASPVSEKQLASFVARELANEVIETYRIDQPLSAPFIINLEKPAQPESVALSKLTTAELVKLSEDLRLALDTKEMETLASWRRSLRLGASTASIRPFGRLSTTPRRARHEL